MEMRRLQNNKYFFSVEGETEELYLSISKIWFLQKKVELQIQFLLFKKILPQR